MGIWGIIVIAFGLAMDAFAVAVAIGLVLPALTRRHVFRLAFHFGLFQFMMPILGWLAGYTVAEYVKSYHHWVVFGLLGFIGGKMLWEAYKSHPSERKTGDPTRGWSLVTLSVVTSLDAFAVGLVLAFQEVPIWMPSILIGLVAGAMTMIGIELGHRIGDRFGRWAEALGGVVLIGIGIYTLISHLYP